MPESPSRIPQNAPRESTFADARRKLVEGTEVLRTGSGARLTAIDCNAILDRLDDLERYEQALRQIARGKPVTIGRTTYVRPGKSRARDALGGQW